VNRVAVAATVLAVAGLIVVSPLYGVIAAIPAIARDLRIAPVDVSWIGFTFGIAYAASALLFGPLSDVLGRRSILVGGLAASAASTAAVALSPNIDVLYVTRAIAGLCAGTYGPVCLGWMFDRYTGEARANAIAVVSAGLIGAGTVGQLIVGAYAPLGWRIVFWLFALLDGACAIAVAVVVRDASSGEREASLLAAYGAEFSALKCPQILTLYGSGFILYGGFVAFYVVLAGHLVEGGALTSQLTLARAIGLPGIALSLFSGRAIATFGARKVTQLSLTVGAAGLAICALFPSCSIEASAIYVLGFAFAAVAINNLLGSLAGPARGSVIAFFVFCSFAGTSISVPLASAFIHAPLTGTMALLAALYAIAALAIALIVKQPTALRHTA